MNGAFVDGAIFIYVFFGQMLYILFWLSEAWFVLYIMEDVVDSYVHSGILFE